ncbi:MAG TPA: hypothetical protein VFN03_11190, partial [Trueperaceae bacterium]|nr:hypothetical protein [Trueperaceae bacterium]
MTRHLVPAWRLALFSLLLAMLTGAALRFAFIYGLPWGLRFEDVRHAHSHLMFFAWATPVLVLVAAEAVRRAGGNLAGAGACAIAAAVAGLLAYIPFLVSGYRMLPVGGRELPLSMMASGLNGLLWYVFAALYVAGSWRLTRNPALRLLDGAVVLLLFSSLGAVLLAVTGVNGTATPTSTAAFVDLFLTLFADGWFGVGLVAALVLTHFGANARSTFGFGAAAWLLTLGLALRSGARVATDAYGVQGLDLVERCGGLVAACGWLYLTLSQLTDRRSVPRPTESGVVAPVAPPSITDSPGRQVAVAALWLLALKAVVEAFVALPFGEELFVRWSLRVLLLHAFLLGAVTLGLVAAIRTLLSPRAFVPVRTLAL